MLLINLTHFDFDVKKIHTSPMAETEEMVAAIALNTLNFMMLFVVRENVYTKKGEVFGKD